VANICTRKCDGAEAEIQYTYPSHPAAWAAKEEADFSISSRPCWRIQLGTSALPFLRTYLLGELIFIARSQQLSSLEIQKKWSYLNCRSAIHPVPYLACRIDSFADQIPSCWRNESFCGRAVGVRFYRSRVALWIFYDPTSPADVRAGNFAVEMNGSR
jgi:hypothetical protein